MVLFTRLYRDARSKKHGKKKLWVPAATFIWRLKISAFLQQSNFMYSVTCLHQTVFRSLAIAAWFYWRKCNLFPINFNSIFFTLIEVLKQRGPEKMHKAVTLPACIREVPDSILDRNTTLLKFFLWIISVPSRNCLDITSSFPILFN